MNEYSVTESVEQQEGGSPESIERSIVNRGHGEKLSRFMDQAILALLESRTFKEAAKKVGVAESTLRGWCRDPVFREHYDTARRHILEVGTMEIADLKLEGLRILRAELNDWSEPAIRHDAAKFVVTLPDRELQRLDADRRFNAQQEKTAGKHRGTMTFLEILNDCGMGVSGFVDLLSAALEKVDPEGADREGEGTVEAAGSSQIIAAHRENEDEREDRDVTNAKSHDADEQGCDSSAQIIADNGTTNGSHVEDNGDQPVTTMEPIGEGVAHHGTSAQIDADARKTDGTHPVGDSTREHGGNEHGPKPVILRRRHLQI
jgi:hypothetical protein